MLLRADLFIIREGGHFHVLHDCDLADFYQHHDLGQKENEADEDEDETAEGSHVADVGVAPFKFHIQARLLCKLVK